MNQGIRCVEEHDGLLVSSHPGSKKSGTISFKPLTWDSEVLGLRCGRISLADAAGDPGTVKNLVAHLLANQAAEYNLIMFRFPSLHMNLAQQLQSLGFYLVENLLTFKYILEQRLQPGQAANPGLVIRRLNDKNRDETERVCRIAENEFKYSRYHMDPNLSAGAAGRLKAAWVRNSCLGRASAVLVAEQDGECAGFALCNLLTKGQPVYGVLDLIGVDRRYANRGIGKALVRGFLDFISASGAAYGIAGTQSHNLGSIRMYSTSGFALDTSELTYHYFRKNQP